MWEVETRYIESWLDDQDTTTVAHIFAALEMLQREEPALGRPLVDSLEGSSLKHLKELRPPTPGRTEVRILFAFDPWRRAILLLAGDKAKGKSVRDKWIGWYRQAIPRAEKVYREHLENQGEHHEQP